MADIRSVSPLTRADWRISLRREGSSKDLTPQLAERLISLTVRDERGNESDEITLELDDGDGKLALPPTGALLSVAIGWYGLALVDKGTFTVDEISHSGPPDKVTLRGRAAQVGGNLGVKKERSWREITLGNLCRTIAKEHGLAARIHQQLDRSDVVVEHIDQTGESDVNFLTRLARNFDAIATVKAGNLLVMPAGESSTVSGAALPTIVISRSDGDQHRYQVEDRGQYTGVRAYWNDLASALRQEFLAGTGEREKVLRDAYPTEAEAKRAAVAELQRIERGTATLSLSLAKGRPEILAESPVTVTGYKSEISDTAWVAKSVEQRLDGNGGLTTTLELEINPSHLSRASYPRP